MPELTDVRILSHLLLGQRGKGTHQEKLQRFYAPQADSYDQFRKRLLHGRRAMLDGLKLEQAESIVELGAGTGQNLGFVDPGIIRTRDIHLVDLCPALIKIARARYQHYHNINIVEADATTYDPGFPVDRVYLSYALTMIPDWQAAIHNALRMLKPGGLLGVVDFCTRPEPECLSRQLMNKFWTTWFAHDGVHLNPQHKTHLQQITQLVHLLEARAAIPYLPGLKAHYYIYIGRKI